MVITKYIFICFFKWRNPSFLCDKRCRLIASTTLIVLQGIGDLLAFPKISIYCWKRSDSYSK